MRLSSLLPSYRSRASEANWAWRDGGDRESWVGGLTEGKVGPAPGSGSEKDYEAEPLPARATPAWSTGWLRARLAAAEAAGRVVITPGACRAGSRQVLHEPAEGADVQQHLDDYLSPQARGRPLPRHHGQHDRHRRGGSVLDPRLPLHLLSASEAWPRGLSCIRSSQGLM